MHNALSCRDCHKSAELNLEVSSLLPWRFDVYTIQADEIYHGNSCMHAASESPII